MNAKKKNLALAGIAVLLVAVLAVAAVFFFLPVAGAFAVGCGLRYLFRKAPCPWVLTLILLR